MSNDNDGNFRKDEIGAFWNKVSGNGAPFKTGSITCNCGCNHKMDVVVFPNRYKKEERHPDERVLISTPKGSREPGDAPPVNYPAPSQRQARHDDRAQQRSGSHGAQPRVPDDSDIPF